MTIPCPGEVESLNAAVAASMLLYEASRQRCGEQRRSSLTACEVSDELVRWRARMETVQRAATLHSAPLAERMRPRTLEELSGQEHLLGPGKPLRVQIERDARTRERVR